MVSTRKQPRVNYSNVVNGIDDTTDHGSADSTKSRCRQKKKTKSLHDSKPKSSHNSKTSIPHDSNDNSPPPQPTIPRSAIYRIHANLRLKPSVTPVVVDFDNLIIDGNEDRINRVKKRCFTDGTLTANGICKVVEDAIEGNSHILQDLASSFNGILNYFTDSINI